MTTGCDDGQARWQRICAVLDAVFDAPDGERERVLAEHCAGDASLRAEVEAMLAAEDTTDRRLDTPAADWAGDVLDQVEADAEAARAHSPGEMIGDYRLVRELGRGGMGTVWLAERSGTEFSQQVALKLLKRGLDTDAVLGRFYEERRILARLRHPHIALFLDGGVADTGQPWFTMEWVDGAPITEWCDARRLGVRERVALFLDAVAAVQYAHQQLVVHRDLKPGNVLVSESGEVKLLDFGIAKMLDTTEGSAQAATMTRMGVRMLTPAYAAPEQLRGDPATTATDVYALGVLLGELLSGRRPLPKSRDATDAPVQRPSSQVTDAAAALRGTSADRLRRQLRGDLDTIVLKALSGEASRRYGSAQAFGEDLRRWLDGQPVQARPDSAWYRTRRFIGRHRLGTAAAAVMVLSLLTGALVATWQAREATRQAEVARRQTLEAEKQTRRAEEVKDFLVQIFKASNPTEWKGKDPTARDLLEIGARRVDDELAGDPLLRAQMQRVIGEMALSHGDFDRAESLLRMAMDEVRRRSGERSRDYADVLHTWANLLYLKGDYAGAVPAAEREVALRRDAFPDDVDAAQALRLLASLKGVSGRTDEAIRLAKEAVSLTRRNTGTLNRLYVEQVLELGHLLLGAHRLDEARPLFEESLVLSKKLHGPDSTMFAAALNGQARWMTERGDLRRAAIGYGEAADIFRRAGSKQTLVMAQINQGDALCRLGRFAEGERAYREAWALKSFATQDRADTLQRNFGKCLSDAGRFSAAEPLLREMVGLSPESVRSRDFVLSGASHMLRLLVRQGRAEEALALVGQVENRFGPVRATDGTGPAVLLALAAPARSMTGRPEQGLDALKGALVHLRALKAPVTLVNSLSIDLAALELEAGQASGADERLQAIGGALDGGSSGPQALRVRMLRGVALMQLDRLPQAERMLRTAVDLRRQMYGEDNTWTGEARLYLGICLLRAGRVDEGRTLVRQARAQFIREAGEDHAVVRQADDALRRTTG